MNKYKIIIISLFLTFVIGLGFVKGNNIFSNLDYVKSSNNVNNGNNNNNNIFGVAGDIMLSRSVGYFNKINNYSWTFSMYNPFYDFYLKYKPAFWVINLESPFGIPDRDIKKAGFIFKANPKQQYILQIIRNCSTNKRLVVNLANNHMNNAGSKGLKLTLDILRKNGFITVGAGLTPTESHKIGVLNINGQKICIQGYTYNGGYRNGIALNSINLKYIKKDVERMNELKCDKKIIILHWGSEYRFNPNKWQKKISNEISKMGVDYVIGGHSHIQGKIDKIGNTQITYSMGNSIFDQNWGERYKDSSMDCVKNKYNKCVVPTYVGMLLGLSTNDNNIQTSLFYRINYGKLEKLNDNVLVNNIKKVIGLDR